ncbi:MAG: hypothetical protein U9P14_03620 [Gemmatimonadota bacterium]|nr:hypothetical protein [Gemmatimonadota bacterium]
METNGHSACYACLSRLWLAVADAYSAEAPLVRRSAVPLHTRWEI